MHPRDETIYALATGRLPSAIAVVRVSGPHAGEALTRLAGKCPPPGLARHVALQDIAQQVIDDAIALWFPGPKSATGEDLAEFHIHGSRAVLKVLFEVLAAIPSLRPAAPGEFTQRAFENGKLDLTQAEALDDLIHADTDGQRRSALRQLGGLLGDRARSWRDDIIAAQALIEAGIDFSDEGDVTGDLAGAARERIAALRADIASVLAGGRSERLRDGLAVAILGPPNVGKSTLLNALAQREAAIVSPVPGTTRDIIELSLDLGGWPVTMIDTAGIRDSADPIEQEGIRRARARAAEADLVLWLDPDGTSAAPADVAGSGAMWRVRSKADEGGIGVDRAVSALTGAGIADLVSAIAAFAAAQFSESSLITRARHRTLLAAAEGALAQAEQAGEAEIVAEHLRKAGAALGRLLGRVDVEDVLGSIFSTFCVGK